jgi:3D (Asp-Asp-Asp) domain-containing protein
MPPQGQVVVRRAHYVVVLALTLAPMCEGSDCETRTMRVSFYTCGEGSARCLTRQGHQPIPFRTVAVGDRALLGRWLYIEDLGGWVHASDTGGALKKNSIDVFIGEERMKGAARRLGIQFWVVRVCAPAVMPALPTPAVARDVTDPPVALAQHSATDSGGAP